MEELPQVAVIVAAAGQGTRLGGHRKQFRVLGGKSVLVQTLLVFERHSRIDQIIVATPEEAVEPLRFELKRIGITKLANVVPGGGTRQDTVAAGLAAVTDSTDIVLVHDAVRPFVRLSKVSAVIDATTRSGASSLALPVSDTLRRVVAGADSEGIFGETIPRDDLYRMQTPQGFRVDWLRKAHAEVPEEVRTATDDVELVQKAGFPVVLVEGCPHNVKITTQEDWDRATRFWGLWTEILSHEEREQIVGDETR